MSALLSRNRIFSVAAVTILFCGEGHAQGCAFSLDDQVFKTLEEAKSDPAFSDGVILIGDANFKPVAFLISAAECRDIDAALVDSDEGNVVLLFDGSIMNTWTNDEFAARAGRVLSVVQQLKTAQAAQN